MGERVLVLALTQYIQPRRIKIRDIQLTFGPTLTDFLLCNQPEFPYKSNVTTIYFKMIGGMEGKTKIVLHVKSMAPGIPESHISMNY